MSAARKKHQPKGIYCLENSGWYGAKDKSTVKPILEMLSDLSGLMVPYFYATVATKEEVSFHIDRYAKPEFNTHPILYFAAHGTDDPHSISLPGADLSLEDLMEILKNRCKNRIVYFGSCGLMNLHGSRLNSFLKEIGAAAVCGYTKDVWWTEAAAFELLFLSSVQEWTLARHDLLKGYRQGLRNVAPGLHRRLGFRMIVRQPKSKQPK